jgi:hypothetical protein
MSLSLALLFGACWFGIAPISTGPGLHALLGFLVYAPAFFAFLMSETSARTVSTWRAVFYRESAAGAYGAAAHSAALALVDLPWQVAFAVVYSAIIYFMVGLRGDNVGLFFSFALGVAGTSYYAVTLTHLFISLTPDLFTAQTLSGLSFALMLLFSGFFIFVGDMRGFYFMYVIDGLAWVLKFFALPQLDSLAAVEITPGVYVTMVSLQPYLFQPPSEIVDAPTARGTTTTTADMWPAFGYLVAIAAILRAACFVGDALVKWR